MADGIPLRPTIPAQMKIAASKGSLVPFVGAGVSKLAGCPSWAEFSLSALRIFVGLGKINHAQLEQIRQLPPRTQISLAMAMSREHRIEMDFEKLLRPASGIPLDAGLRAYFSLGKLAHTFVTTNYDDLLDNVSPPPNWHLDTKSSATHPETAKRTMYSRVEEFTFAALNQPNTVFHIHGCMANPTGMVLTTNDYLTRYANHSVGGGAYRENAYLAFLEMLFSSKNVLFVGYSLSELEVLEYVIHKARSHGKRVENRIEEPRHFLLTGFYSHELELMKSLKSYYAVECGVELMPFSRDEKDWSQLVDVLEFLAEEVPARTLLKLQKREELRGLLE